MEILDIVYTDVIKVESNVIGSVKVRFKCDDNVKYAHIKVDNLSDIFFELNNVDKEIESKELLLIS